MAEKKVENEKNTSNVISEQEHKKLHELNYAHVHLHNQSNVKVRVGTEEEIKATSLCRCKEDIKDNKNLEKKLPTHFHTHNPEKTKKILNRFSRAIGHMEHVKKMVESEVDCSEVLIQLAAVKSAVNNIGRELLKEHLSHCILESVDSGDETAIELLNTALDQFMK